MCKHYFDTEIAADVGINAAILYEHLKFWINHNKKTGKNLKEGKTWTYSTQKELSEQFEYLSVKQVRTALEKLEAAGYIIKGNFNRSGYDRTSWFALGEKAQQEIEKTEGTETPAETPAAVPEIIPVPEQPERPQKAPVSKGKSKYPYGRKQKPKRANPEPLWLFGGGEKGRPIPDLEDKIEKEKYIKRMRELAARCGAVCTV